MKPILLTVIYGVLSILIAFSLIYYPSEVLEASQRGLEMWWTIVFPTLLPFFITAEILIGVGVVHLIGILFEPFMRPLFNVPGVGGFAWAMGMASGYPSGAKITTRLRQDGQLTKREAERLISFSNASNPLFIFGVVSIGFLADKHLGILLAAAHYLGNFLVGICMRFYHFDKAAVRREKPTTLKHILKRVHEARLKDNRPLGQLLGDAVIHSVNTLMLIGGFIILFSVLTTLIIKSSVSTLIISFISHTLALFSLPDELAPALWSGLFEITIGIHQLSDFKNQDMLVIAILVSILLAFNGLSIQAQVASIIATSDISFKPYFIGRLLHALFASILTYVLFDSLYLSRTEDLTSVNSWINGTENPSVQTSLHFLSEFGPPMTLLTMIITIYILFLRIKKA